MIPIYEHGTGNGIGLRLQSFLQRFDEICDNHIKTGRAKAFAFIFYDFLDNNFREILNNQGVFTRLDRLSGSELSIFYLHANTRLGIETFNTEFISVLGVEDRITLPCIVFFRIDDSYIKDVEIALLESPDLIHGFDELYQTISHYLEHRSSAFCHTSRTLRWIKASSKFIGLEIFKFALKKGMDFLSPF